MNPSCVVCDDPEEWDDEEGDPYPWEDEEVPANDHIKDAENDGEQFFRADFGIGFLSSLNGREPDDVEGSVFIDEEDEATEEEEEESTVGEVGWGKVIDGLDAATEFRLYQDMVKAYGLPWREYAPDVMAYLILIGGAIAGYIEAEVIKSSLLLTTAWITSMVYIITRR
ncbi:MAG: hypothetical protein AB7U75_14170 [Hyphomicrobiaceae bacterium]